IFIDKKDMLYVSDSESEDAPGKDTHNPGCKRGIRGGSVKDGKVQFYIPPPPVSDPKFPPPEGVAVDSHGGIYAAAVQAKEVYKYVKKSIRCQTGDFPTFRSTVLDAKLGNEP